MKLSGDGLSDQEVSRRMGIPRETVRDWRLGRTRRSEPSMPPWTAGPGPCDHNFQALPSDQYCYVLGLYLGDGYIAKHPRTWRLRIQMAARYPRLIEEGCSAIEALMPGQRAHRLGRSEALVEVSMYSKHWPCLFPQHGPGLKHKRVIRLEPWQSELVKRAAKSFVRGLIHSDGCRVIAKDRGVKSVRYHFSNRSEDIKRLYCEALDSLSIPWTRPSEREIAVYRKAAVARLDEFIGPKQ